MSDLLECLPTPSVSLCQRSTEPRLSELHRKLSWSQHSLHSSFLSSLQPSGVSAGDKPTHPTQTGRAGPSLHSDPGGEGEWGRGGRHPGQAAGPSCSGGEGGGEDRSDHPAGPGGLGTLDLRPGLPGGGGGLRHGPPGPDGAEPAGGGGGAPLRPQVGRPGQAGSLRGGAGGSHCSLNTPGEHQSSQHRPLRGCPGSSDGLGSR